MTINTWYTIHMWTMTCGHQYLIRMVDNVTFPTCLKVLQEQSTWCLCLPLGCRPGVQQTFCLLYGSPPLPFSSPPPSVEISILQSHAVEGDDARIGLGGAVHYVKRTRSWGEFKKNIFGFRRIIPVAFKNVFKFFFLSSILNS